MTQNCGIAFYSDLLARHDYALVDRTLVPAETLEDFPLIPLVPLELRSDEPKMPALLPLEPGAAYLGRLAARMKAGEEDPVFSPVATLISTSPDIKQSVLAFHLTSRLIIRGAWGKFLVYFYRSNVFPHLVRILSPRQLQSLFGKKGEIRAWTFCFQDEWQIVPEPEIREGVSFDLFVTDEQLESIILIGMVNEVLDEYREGTGHPWAGYAEWDKQARRAELSLGIAQRACRLTDPDDQKAFAMHALAHGGRFYRHPLIENILGAVASRPGTYSELASRITDGQWAAIRTETPLAATD
jgi:hypothetical protein